MVCSVKKTIITAQRLCDLAFKSLLRKAKIPYIFFFFLCVLQCHGLWRLVVFSVIFFLSFKSLQSLRGVDILQ